MVPNLLASAEPGELFVIRNIASLVPPCGDAFDSSVQAAVSYAVDNLRVSDIVVCGHSSCGGINALLAGARTTDSLGRWLTNAQPALTEFREKGPLDQTLPDNDQVSQLCVLQQLQHLLTYPSVQSRVKSGELNLHPWWFDIASGQMQAYSADLNRYVPALKQLSQRYITSSALRVA